VVYFQNQALQRDSLALYGNKTTRIILKILALKLKFSNVL
jgi:hypothetical protein